MKTIKHDLILKKDMTFKESITVEGDIKGYFNLKVIGNINAWNIDTGNIDARDIDARNINARNIDTGDIDARDIDAWNIICKKRIKKMKSVKTICRVYITNISKLEMKERG